MVRNLIFSYHFSNDSVPLDFHVLSVSKRAAESNDGTTSTRHDLKRGQEWSLNVLVLLTVTSQTPLVCLLTLLVSPGPPAAPEVPGARELPHQRLRHALQLLAHFLFGLAMGRPHRNPYRSGVEEIVHLLPGGVRGLAEYRNHDR